MPAADVVRGDIILLEAGDRIPADLRLLRAKSLRTDEAALIGESVSVDKGLEAVRPKASLAERASMAWSGTLVAAGAGMGVAVATGPATELGRISAMLGRVDTLQTSLLRQMARFARQVTGAILALSAALFALFRAIPNLPSLPPNYITDGPLLGGAGHFRPTLPMLGVFPRVRRSAAGASWPLSSWPLPAEAMDGFRCASRTGE